MSMAEVWFFAVKELILKKIVSNWCVCVEILSHLGAHQVVITCIRKAVFVLLTCLFIIGGVIIGIITGAIKGQTTETGFFRGAGIGMVAGAITAVQVLESLVAGESLSKVALLGSVMNGKVFIEWVSPAVLKAYQWQINTLETNSGLYEYDISGDTSDIYDISSNKGLPQHVIQNLPQHKFDSTQCDQLCCTICLMDLKDGDHARRLAICKHIFHLDCIDKWIARQGTCPVCREDICVINGLSHFSL